MEFITGFIAGMIWWEWWLVIAVLGAFGFDDHWSPWPIFILVAAGFIFCTGLFLGDGIFHFFAINWLEVLIRCCFYLVIGVVWSGFKWVRLLYKLRAEIMEWLVKYSDTYDSPVKKKERIEQVFYEYVRGEDIKFDGSIHPNIKYGRNFDRATSWIIFWPISVVNYVFGKLLKELVDFIVDSFKGIYNALARSIFSGVSIK